MRLLVLALAASGALVTLRAQQGTKEYMGVMLLWIVDIKQIGDIKQAKECTKRILYEPEANRLSVVKNVTQKLASFTPPHLVAVKDKANDIVPDPTCALRYALKLNNNTVIEFTETCFPPSNWIFNSIKPSPVVIVQSASSIDMYKGLESRTSMYANTTIEYWAKLGENDDFFKSLGFISRGGILSKELVKKPEMLVSRR